MATPTPPATPGAPPRLFDPVRRARMRDRRLAGGAEADPLAPIIAESLLDRLSVIQRPFAAPLLVGAHNADLTTAMRERLPALTIIEAGPRLAAAAGATTLSEEALLSGIARGVHDLAVWPSGLESVNDVPGALIQLRLALRPDAPMLGAVVGDGSYPALRRALQAADPDRGVPRMQPQIDVRALGDLLSRAGLVLPVIDVEVVELSYRCLRALVRDLRMAGLGRSLAAPVVPLGRQGLARAEAAFAAMRGDDGRVIETVRVLHFLGWTPGPDQPRPARPGSAKTSLSTVLSRSSEG